MLEAKSPLPSLVEWRDKRNEFAGIVPESDIDICLGPGVAWVEDNGATIGGPTSTVVGGDGLVNTTAGVGPIWGGT